MHRQKQGSNMNSIQASRNRQYSPTRRIKTSSQNSVQLYINEQFSGSSSYQTIIGGTGGSSVVYCSGSSSSSTQNRGKLQRKQTVNQSADRNIQNSSYLSTDGVLRNSSNKPKFYFLEKNKQDLSNTAKEFVDRQNAIIKHKRTQSQNKEIKLSTISYPTFKENQLFYSTQNSLQQKSQKMQEDLHQDQYLTYNSNTPNIKHLGNREHLNYESKVAEVEDDEQFRNTKKQSIINQINYYNGDGNQLYNCQKWSLQSFNQVSNNQKEFQKNRNRESTHNQTRSIESHSKSNQNKQLQNNQSKHLQSNKSKDLYNNQNQQFQNNQNKPPVGNYQQTISANSTCNILTPLKTTFQSQEQYECIQNKQKNQILVNQLSLQTTPQLKPVEYQDQLAKSFPNSMYPCKNSSIQTNPQQFNSPQREERIGKNQRFSKSKEKEKYQSCFALDQNKFRCIVKDKLDRDFIFLNDQPRQSQQNEQNETRSQQKAQHIQFLDDNYQVKRNSLTQHAHDDKLKIRFRNDSNLSHKQDGNQYNIKLNDINQTNINQICILNSTDNQNLLQNDKQINQSNTPSSEQIIDDNQLDNGKVKTSRKQSFQVQNANKISKQQIANNQALSPQTNTQSNNQNLKYVKSKAENNSTSDQCSEKKQNRKTEEQIMITPQQIEQILRTQEKKKRIQQQKMIYDLVKQVEENPLLNAKDSHLSLTQQQNSNNVLNKQITIKNKTRNSLIQDIIQSKSRQSVAVIQDILRTNNITEIPERIDSPKNEVTQQQHENGNNSVISNQHPNKCKQIGNFTQTLQDLKQKNGHLQNSIHSMISNNRNRNSFRQITYEDTINETQTNVYHDSLSPRDKNPLLIEQINESKYYQQITKDKIIQKKNGTLLRKALKEALHYISKLKISPHELMYNVVFSTKPFQKKHSHDLINAAKKGDLQSIKDIILDSKYLVYDFDFVYLTGLHWACKRGHIQVAQHLIQQGSDVDAKDLLLLMNQASPWSNSEYDLNELSKDNPKMITLLSRFRKFNIVAKMCKPNLRQDFWKKQSLYIDF